MANKTRAQLSVDSSTNFPDNTSQLISPADLRDWITNGIDSFVTQKDISSLQNAIYENRSDAIVAGATTDLSIANGNFVHITGTTLITSFGSLQKGARFIITFDDAANIQASANLIIPGVSSGSTKTAVPGDCCMIVSEDPGAWRIVGYFPAAGAGSGLVVDVTATTPISSTGGTTPDISITQANGSTDGYLSQGDWTNFDSKVSASGTPSSGEFAQFTSSNDITTATASTSKLLIGTNDSSNVVTEISLGTNLTMSGSTLNASGGGGGGTPGGADGEIQYNNGLTAFGGVADLTWDDLNSVLTIKNPRIGQSTGNGHFHMHTINTSPPSGVTDYITLYADKSPKQIGARFETDGYTSAIQFGATTDQTYTLPNASGNVVVDSASQTLSNKTLSTPTVSGIATIGNGASAGEIRLLEGSGSGSNYVAVKSPATLGGNLDFVLPSTAGTSGYVLQTDGSGNLSYVRNGGTINGSYILDTTETTATGTSELINKTLLIPANTFSSQTAFKITVRTRKDNAGFNVVNIKLYLNTTSSTISGAFSLGGVTFAASGSTTGLNIERGLVIISSTQTSYNLVTNNSNDFASGTITLSNIDWTVNQHVIVTTQCNNAAYSAFVRAIQIIPQ